VNHSEIVSFLWGVADLIRDTFKRGKVEIKLALATSLRELRRQKRLTQAQVAEKLESSQSRVAKMEAADPTVSLDLLVRSLLVLGKTRREVGELLAS
jgi:predicted XRE-type DNA-binding protein